jgi:DNA end-binding protein Ku
LIARTTKTNSAAPQSAIAFVTEKPLAPRSFWDGYLKLSLVTCRVAMVPARSDSEKIKFHALNRKTGNRLEARLVDDETGKPVAEDDQVKAYQSGEKEFVLLEDDDLAAVALESARTIDIEMFVPKDSIAWIWFDQPHYLLPNDKVGLEAFAVIREAMAATGMVGVSRLVLYRRERAVMLQPLDDGLALWTLRYGDEVRDPKDYWQDIGSGKPDPKLLSMITKLIGQKTTDWDPKLASDPVQKNLAKIIAAKKKGARGAAKSADDSAAQDRGNVVSIFDALRKSVAAEGKRSGKG